MKKIAELSSLVVLLIVIGTSCKKQTVDQMYGNKVPRKVQFILYTDKDFSNDNHIITFKLSIQKTPNDILWDSLLAPMRIKDIPHLTDKLVIEKNVPGNDPSLLKVSFFYSIENVGNSWYVDAFPIGETFKTVDFNFQ
jgi:hypothetical protein